MYATFAEAKAALGFSLTGIPVGAVLKLGETFYTAPGKYYYLLPDGSLWEWKGNTNRLGDVKLVSATGATATAPAPTPVAPAPAPASAPTAAYTSEQKKAIVYQAIAAWEGAANHRTGLLHSISTLFQRGHVDLGRRINRVLGDGRFNQVLRGLVDARATFGYVGAYYPDIVTGEAHTAMENPEPAYRGWFLSAEMDEAAASVNVSGRFVNGDRVEGSAINGGYLYGGATKFYERCVEYRYSPTGAWKGALWYPTRFCQCRLRAAIRSMEIVGGFPSLVALMKAVAIDLDVFGPEVKAASPFWDEATPAELTHWRNTFPGADDNRIVVRGPDGAVVTVESTF